MLPLLACSVEHPRAIDQDVTVSDRTLRVSTSRPDITIKELWFNFHCAREATSAEKANHGRTHHRCDGFTVSGEPAEETFTDLSPQQTEPGKFVMDTTRVAFSTACSGHLCMPLKAWFNVQRSGQHERQPVLRERAGSVCTGVGLHQQRVIQSYEWVNTAARFGQNRVATLELFEERLSRPFVIQLNDRPLPE